MRNTLLRYRRQVIVLSSMACFLLCLCLKVSAEKYQDNKTNSSSPLGIYLTAPETPAQTAPVFLRHSPSNINFTIENKTDNVIILRMVNIQRSLPDIARWYGSRYGSAVYDSLNETWIYNEMTQTLSKPFFATGVIRPRGKYQLNRWLIPKTDTVHLEVSYQKLSERTALDCLYFNTDGEDGYSLKHKFTHLKEIGDLDKKGLDTSFVIFPQADKIPIHKEHLSCVMTLNDPEFSLKNAQKKIKEKIHDSVFWKNANIWVIQTDKAVYLVSKDKTEKLGRIDLLSFILIESSSQSVDCILPVSGYEQFGAQRPHFEGPGYFNPGVTRINKEKIIPLFRLAESRHDAIKVLAYDANGLGKRFYLLVGNFNEKARRETAARTDE